MESPGIREELGYQARLGVPSLLGTWGQVFDLKSLVRVLSLSPGLCVLT